MAAGVASTASIGLAAAVMAKATAKREWIAGTIFEVNWQKFYEYLGSL
jgi:hypothetical protein